MVQRSLIIYWLQFAQTLRSLGLQIRQIWTHDTLCPFKEENLHKKTLRNLRRGNYFLLFTFYIPLLLRRASEALCQLKTVLEMMMTRTFMRADVCPPPLVLSCPPSCLVSCLAPSLRVLPLQLIIMFAATSLQIIIWMEHWSGGKHKRSRMQMLKQRY